MKLWTTILAMTASFAIAGCKGDRTIGEDTYECLCDCENYKGEESIKHTHACGDTPLEGIAACSTSCVDFVGRKWRLDCKLRESPSGSTDDSVKKRYDNYCTTSGTPPDCEDVTAEDGAVVPMVVQWNASMMWG